MTTFEIDPNINHDSSFYRADIEGPEVRSMLNLVIASKEPFADNSTNPDIGSMKLYHFEANEYGSDLGRALEAKVFKMDWGQSIEDTEAEARDFEHGSEFFVLVDCEGGEPELVGSLRVVDCQKCVSETENFYRESHGLADDEELPNELSLSDGRAGVWDIASAVLMPEYRGTYATSWLYYGMYTSSVNRGVKMWISNINNDEMRHLKLIGIPFTQVRDTGVIEIPNKADKTRADKYKFYYADVSNVGPAVERRIGELSNRGGGMAETVIKLAMIGRYGSIAVAESFAPVSKIAS